MSSGFDLYFNTFSIFDAFADCFTGHAFAKPVVDPHGDRIAPNRDTYTVTKPDTFADPNTYAIAVTDTLTYAFTLPLAKPDAITVADPDT